MSNVYQIGETVFGSWQITEKLDQGSSGALYQIHKRDALGNDYYSALKVITIPSGGDNEVKSLLSSGITKEDLDDYYQDVIDTASNEFTILSRLKGNSNIVSYEDHEIVKHNDSLGWDILIRMEQTTPLVDYCLKHELTEDDVLKMGIDICSALELCSRHNIIHRDIKPANIFVSENGDFKLGDFGIARITEQTQTYLSRKGTFTYMAPEVFRGDPYTENVDLYSLGLVMYQFLNNRRGPFVPEYPQPIVYEDNEKAFARRMSGDEMSEPANGSPRIKEIVLKACAYESSKRYASAKEMLDDLQELTLDSIKAIKQEQKLQELPPGKRDMYKLWNKRKRTITVAIVALLFCASLLSVFLLRGVTDIEGIGDNTKLLVNDSISPEYRVSPFIFSNSKITFSSSDEKVFTVDEKGTITATGVGDAIMTMKCRSYTDNVQIQVEPKVSRIENVSDIKIYAGESKTLKPRLIPEKYADAVISYTTADSSIVKVSKKGKITGVKAGSTTITISAGGAKKKIRVKVIDKPAQTQDNNSGSSNSGNYGSSGSSNSGSSNSGSSSGSSSNSGSSSGGSNNSGSSSGDSGNSGSSSGGDGNSSGGDYFDDDEFF